jgi:hypothetical protein
MEVEDVPPALQERLGHEGTAALVELLEQARQDCTMDVSAAAVERFERRLSDAHTQLREDMVARDAKLREELVAGDAKLREEIAKLREEMKEGDAELRHEMIRGFSAVREDMAVLKFDLLKWSFAFWVGQIVAVSAVLGVMLRAMQT